MKCFYIIFGALSLTFCSQTYGMFESNLSFGRNSSSGESYTIQKNDESSFRKFLYSNVNKNWAEKENVDSFGVDFSRDELYIFALNVGQANCILLRKRDEVAIIDAGISNEAIGAMETTGEGLQRKLESILKDAKVRYIFITHPHEDHFSLITKESAYQIRALNANDGRSPKFILGGLKANWKVEGKHRLGVYVPQEKEIDYYTDISIKDDASYYLSGAPNLSDVKFEVLNASDFVKKGSVNCNSFIIRVSYKGKNILFTGDAEGATLGSVIKQCNNVSQLLQVLLESHDSGVDKQQLKKFIENISDVRHGKFDVRNADELSEQYNNLRDKSSSLPLPEFKKEDFERIINGYNKLKAIIIDDQSMAKLVDNNALEEREVSEMLATHYKNLTINKREKLSNIDMVVLPHHGTNTENSQRWLGYFVGHKQKPIFLISSSPFESNRLPKRSIVEMIAELGNIPSHPIVYAHDDSDLLTLRSTKRPVYVTGAAPGGIYCFSISDDSKLSMLDVCDRSDGFQFRWFNLVTKTITDEDLSENLKILEQTSAYTSTSHDEQQQMKIRMEQWLSQKK